MKHILIALSASLIGLSLIGCTLDFSKQTTPYPTPVSQASPTALVALPAMSQPTPIGTAAFPVATLSSAGFDPTATVAGIVPGNPSGPYGVIQVVAGDALNIRSGPGLNYPVVASFPPTTNNVMRTGPSASVSGALWVEIVNPAGGTGWVHSGYLTEYMAPSNFCADTRALAVVANFADALKTSNGNNLAGLVSPANGWSLRLWRNGNVVVFDRQHAQWIFVSTYEHHWGAAPGSGLDTVGAVHTVVLPKFLDVINAPPPGYALTCNSIQGGGATYTAAWPVQYTNVNYYSLYKPGPAGNELSWRTLLLGIEYVGGQPYLFSTTQLEWEP